MFLDFNEVTGSNGELEDIEFKWDLKSPKRSFHRPANIPPFNNQALDENVNSSCFNIKAL